MTFPNSTPLLSNWVSDSPSGAPLEARRNGKNEHAQQIKQLEQRTALLEQNSALSDTVDQLQTQVRQLSNELRCMKAVVQAEYREKLRERESLFRYYVKMQDHIATHGRRYLLWEDDAPRTDIKKLGNFLGDCEMVKTRQDFVQYADVFRAVYGISVEETTALLPLLPDFLDVLNIRGTLHFDPHLLVHHDNVFAEDDILALTDQAIDWYKKVVGNDKRLEGAEAGLLRGFLAKVTTIDLTAPVHGKALDRQIGRAKNCEGVANEPVATNGQKRKLEQISAE
jgi:hypothetical protein